MKVTDVLLDTVRTTRRTGSISVHIVVRLVSDTDHVGLGEISDLDCYRMHLPDVDHLRDAIRMIVVGRDPRRQAAFHRDLFKVMPTYLRSANTYPPFQLGSQIAAGVEMALYDLAGKAYQAPVHDLLGGRVRDSLEMTYPVFPTASEIDRQRNLSLVDDLMTAGIDRVRYYVGVDVDSDEEFLGAVRSKYGKAIHIKALDFQGRMYWKDALRAIDRLAPFDVDVVESVSWAEDYSGMAEVRRRTSQMVSEHVSSYAQAMRMIRESAVDVFNVTLQSGGIWGAQRLFALADAAGLKALLSTTQEMSIGTAAAAHLGAAVPELDVPGDVAGPLIYREDVTVARIKYEGPRLIVPTGVGLGVELDLQSLDAIRGSLVEWDKPAHGEGYVPA